VADGTPTCKKCGAALVIKRNAKGAPWPACPNSCVSATAAKKAAKKIPPAEKPASSEKPHPSASAQETPATAEPAPVVSEKKKGGAWW
jgi:hypothetical protein